MIYNVYLYNRSNERLVLVGSKAIGYWQVGENGLRKPYYPSLQDAIDAFEADEWEFRDPLKHSSNMNVSLNLLGASK